MLTTAQDNRFTAYENLHQALTSDATPYQTDEAMKDIVAELGLGLAGIRVLRQDKTRPNKGPAQTKLAAKQFLADVGAEIAGDLFEWATKNQNATLQAVADYSASDLVNLRGTRIYDTTGEILKAARDYQTTMGKYAIADARLQELDDARESFNTLRPGPRQQQTQQGAIKKTLNQRFSEMATLVQDRFERAIRKYQRLDADFYHRVMQARAVIDRPGTHDSPTAPSHT